MIRAFRSDYCMLWFIQQDVANYVYYKADKW